MVARDRLWTAECQGTEHSVQPACSLCAGAPMVPLCFKVVERTQLLTACGPALSFPPSRPIPCHGRRPSVRRRKQLRRERKTCRWCWQQWVPCWKRSNKFRGCPVPNLLSRMHRSSIWLRTPCPCTPGPAPQGAAGAGGEAGASAGLGSVGTVMLQLADCSITAHLSSTLPGRALTTSSRCTIP